MKHFFSVLLLSISLLLSRSSYAQHSRLDALFAGSDTTAVMDSLMQGFDAFLDSITKPKSFFSVSAGVGTGLFNFKNTASFDFNVKKRAVYVPEISYFHKSGLGITATAYMMSEAGKLNSYQYAISPSYHYIKQKHFSTGVSFTRYYTRENLTFYTTPIQNELYSFFNYKKWWLEPGFAVSYGWGSKTKFEQREVEVFLKRLKSSSTKIINVQRNESIKDLSMLVSVRHSFEWYQLFSSQDMLTLTPIALLSGGTQNFGFNTTFSSNSKFINNNILPANQNITDKSGLHLQSATLVMQVEYMRNRFYILPQILLDYYLHLSDKRLNSIYSFTVGYNF